MTYSIQGEGYPEPGSGGPLDASPEQRMPEWTPDQADAAPRSDRDLSARGPGEIDPAVDLGVDPAELTDEDLIREMQSLHRTRLDTLRHAADPALANHLRRTAELETEYLARHPGREIDPDRLRG